MWLTTSCGDCPGQGSDKRQAKKHFSPITSHLGSRVNAPGVTRTLDLRIRNPLLYPAELRAQITGPWAIDPQVFYGHLLRLASCNSKNQTKRGKKAASKSSLPQVQGVLCQSFRGQQSS